MSIKKNMTSAIMFSCILFTGIVIMAMFFSVFGKYGYMRVSSDQLPKRIIELNNTPDEFHVFKIAHSQPVTHPQHISLSDKIEFEIKKDQSIRIIPEIYPSNQLGNPQNLIQAIRSGTIEMAVISAEELWVLPEFSIFSVPYLFNEYGDLERFMSNPEVAKSFEKALSSMNIKYMGWGFRNFNHIFKIVMETTDRDERVSLINSNALLEQYFRDLGLIVHQDEMIDYLSNVHKIPYSYAQISSEIIDYSNSLINIDDVLLRNYLLQPCFYIFSFSFWDKLSLNERNLIQRVVDQSIEYEKTLILESEKKYQDALSRHFIDSPGGKSFNPNVFKTWEIQHPYLNSIYFEG